MNTSNPIEHLAQRADELVSWTGRERLRMLWYRLRLTISEMNYAVQRLTELQMRLPDVDRTPRCHRQRTRQTERL
jgi:hypothetical protein